MKSNILSIQKPCVLYVAQMMHLFCGMRTDSMLLNSYGGADKISDYERERRIKE